MICYFYVQIHHLFDVSHLKVQESTLANASKMKMNAFEPLESNCLLVKIPSATISVEFVSHHWHPHCKFLYWHQEFLCLVEPLYFSDEKSITVEK